MDLRTILVLLAPILLAPLAWIIFRRSGPVNQSAAPARLRGLWLLALLPVLEFLVESSRVPVLDEDTGFRVAGLAELAIASVVLALNWRAFPRPLRRWATIAAVGVVCNAVPRLALGGMPFSPSAARAAGYSEQMISTHHPGHIPLPTVSDLWTPVSDVIPIPGLTRVVSAGDLLLIGGLAVAIAWWLMNSPGAPTPDQPPTPLTNQVEGG